MKTFKRWLLKLLESRALRKIAADDFKDDRDRESVRRLLATVRAFRGSLDLHR